MNSKVPKLLYASIIMTLLIDAVSSSSIFETETEEVRSLTQRRRSHDYMSADGYVPGRYPGGYMGAYGGGFDGGYLSGFLGGYGRMIPPLNPRVYTDPEPIGCCGIGGLYI